MSDEEPPSLRAELRELILEALGRPYVSRSCKDGIETGNHYQSVLLEAERTRGFRTERLEALDTVDFHGRKVVDLGSNLGEMSRYARSRGADLVDGHELDPFFVEVANAINALNGTTRVSFHRSDITDPGLYEERYDITLALSVFVYVQDVIERIAATTDELLVLETHRLDDNLESLYLPTVLPHFPHFEVLGRTEWGTCVDETIERAVIAFAKDPALLPGARRAALA